VTVILELDGVPMLADGELELVLVEHTLQGHGRVPTFRYEMRVEGQRVGSASLRVGDNEYIERYAGHIGYGVDFGHRGKRYAARATRLLLGVARRHRMTTLWITCNPENVASRRTIERVGGELVDIVDVPPDVDLYREGDRQKCRYRVRL
jgi:tagatose 1,6-diphosphate aldolase